MLSVLVGQMAIGSLGDVTGVPRWWYETPVKLGGKDKCKSVYFMTYGRAGDHQWIQDESDMMYSKEENFNKIKKWSKVEVRVAWLLLEFGILTLDHVITARIQWTDNYFVSGMFRSTTRMLFYFIRDLVLKSPNGFQITLSDLFLLMPTFWQNLTKFDNLTKWSPAEDCQNDHLLKTVKLMYSTYADQMNNW